MSIFKKLVFCLGLSALLQAEEGVSALVQRGIEFESHGHNKEALVFYTQAHKKGDLLATAFVGKMYLGGWGVKKDACRAVGYFELVVSHGHNDKELAMLVAKVGLASAYVEGACVSVDSAKALKLVKDVLYANGAGDVHGGALRVERLWVGDFSTTPLRKEYIGIALYLLGNGANPKALSTQMIDIETLKKAVEFDNEYAKRELRIAELAHQEKNKQSRNERPTSELVD
ncbi:hypothetical protein [Helicobacter sp. NHP22-001]|uniref:hypothetical protein n=1 Tax=Helicobacter sp. NHP22-001 TaxID=3040202 RepID=UPI00244D8912|nr:hypothetical protein [Helicobacter sp. NHP22-001]GMB95646.1 hypothetical protein NHP22001_02350 [Helicobacter sp. NHP22-001]